MGVKKYYWLKLPQEFFQKKKIFNLKSMQKGHTYVLIYQEMLLVSLKDDGMLYFEDLAEDLSEEVTLLLLNQYEREDVDFTIKYLLKVGLLEKINENEYILTQGVELVGKETSTERSRKSRSKINATNLQYDATLMQHNATNLQQSATFMKHDATNLQHNATPMQHNATNLQQKCNNREEKKRKEKRREDLEKRKVDIENTKHLRNSWEEEDDFKGDSREESGEFDREELKKIFGVL
jgi:predicted phage replisome organizer